MFQGGWCFLEGVAEADTLQLVSLDWQAASYWAGCRCSRWQPGVSLSPVLAFVYAMLFTTLTKPTSVPWHPQACTAGWMEALVKAFLFLKGRQRRRRQRRGLIFSQKVLQMNTIASVNGQLLDHQSGSHDVHAFLSHETCSERFTIRCCPWSVASCSVHTPKVQ